MSQKEEPTADTDSPFVPCDDECINKFLQLTKPTSDDIIVDLGCGDARLLIIAAKKAKCKCIGIEIQSNIVANAKQNVIENNVTDLVEIIECDFKSLQCQKIIQTSTIVFLFLLPKIMPTITNILSKINYQNRVVSYIFDLSRIKQTQIENKQIIEINNWSYPTLGCTQLKYIQQKGIFLSNLHPVLIIQINERLAEGNHKCLYKQKCQYRLIEVNGKNMDVICNLYDFIVFKRYLHNVLTNYYQYRYNKCNNKYYLSLVVECTKTDIEDVEIVRPKETIQVTRKFKNGSERMEKLKLYQFPLNEKDFGFIDVMPKYVYQPVSLTTIDVC